MEIIAEVGSNWHTREDCLASIATAKECGADVVKFQLFSFEELYGFKQFGAGTGIISGPYLPRDFIPDLARYAKEMQIEFMCTPFSVSGIDCLNPFVERFKIASSNLNHPTMLKRLNEIKKPVIISGGGHTFEEMTKAYEMLPDCEVTVLYCVSEYPARYINFNKMISMSEIFPRVGFSDHSIDILNIPVMAMDFGACMIEKHVNFTNWDDTPDAPHSLNKDEFTLMVRALKSEEVPLEFNEDQMRTHHNVRCIATKDISRGDTFKLNDNYGFFRSKKLDIFGLNPLEHHLIEGKQARFDFIQGKGIGTNGIL